MIPARSWLVFVLAIAPACPAQARNDMNIRTPAQLQAFVVSRDGKTAAGWGKDGKIRVWNLSTGQIVRSLEPKGEGASQVCVLSTLPCGLLLSQDGRWLFFGDSKGGAHIWDSVTGDVQFETALGHYIGTAALSGDGAMLAVAPAGEPAHVLDLRSKHQLFQLASDFGGPVAVKFSPDGSLIASADSDTAIRVFDAHTGKLKWRFDEMTLEPFSIDFTPDSKFVLVGGANRSLISLDASSGKVVRSYPKQEHVVRYLEVSPNGSAVAVAYSDEKGSSVPAPVMIFDIGSWNVRAQCTPNTPIIGGGWTEDGRLLLATATSETLQIWSLR